MSCEKYEGDGHVPGASGDLVMIWSGRQTARILGQSRQGSGRSGGSTSPSAFRSALTSRMSAAPFASVPADGGVAYVVGRLEQLARRVDVADAVERRNGLAVDGVDLERLRARNGRTAARGAVRAAVNGRDRADRSSGRDRALRVALVFAPVRRLTFPQATTIVEEASAVAGTIKPARSSSRVSSAATAYRAPGLGSRVGDHDVPLRGGQVCPSMSHAAMTQPDHTGLPQRD